jgi:hypothetical protein
MLTKETRRLFQGQYQYKAVLVCPAAGWFRGKNLNEALDKIKEGGIGIGKNPFNKVKTPEDFDYCIRLAKSILKMENFDIRVESPFLSFYTNNRQDMDLLIKIDPERVKYISVPNGTVEMNTIIMPKIDFDFRVTLGKSNKRQDSFVEWADANNKIKLTKSCKDQLLRSVSWGGSYFYVKGEKQLLMAKMMLGGSINKVETIIKK